MIFARSSSLRALSLPLIVLCLCFAGCAKTASKLTVKVTNDTSIELSNVTVELKRSSETQTIAVLKPAESVTLTFQKSKDEDSFSVSAIDPSGTRVAQDVGYVDHDSYGCELRFHRSSATGNIAIDFRN